MTKQRALQRLLEHGAMDEREIVECTRWSRRQVTCALGELQRKQVVRAFRKNGSGNGYSYFSVKVAPCL